MNRRLDTIEKGVGGSTYFCEAGLIPAIRTKSVEEIQTRLRLTSLCSSSVIIHPGAIFEEPAFYNTMMKNKELINSGFIKIALRSSFHSLEPYAQMYIDGYRNKECPVFYQARKLNRKNLDIVLSRFDEFEKLKYSIVHYNASSAGQYFQNAIIFLLENDYGYFDFSLKQKILELAKSPSPLGNIRIKALDGQFRKVKGLVTFAKKLNLAYYNAGAVDLNTWFSFNRGLSSVIDEIRFEKGNQPSKFAFWSVKQAFHKVGLNFQNIINRIPDEDFANIINSGSTKSFKNFIASEIENVIKADKATFNKTLMDENLFDTFRSRFENILKKKIAKEYKLSKRVKQMDIALQVIMSLVPIPIVANLASVLMSNFAIKSIKAKVAPIIYTAELLQEGILKDQKA